MTDPLSPAVMAWLEWVLGSQAVIETIQPAKGATSSSVYLVAARLAGREERFVLRLFTNAAWLADEPDLAEHEAAVLRLAHQAGLPAPELVAYAADEAACGLPAVLMRHLPGRVELRPDDLTAWLGQLAERLAQIHHVSADDLGWDYFSWTDQTDLRPPAWSKQPALWERAIEIGQAGPPAYQPVLLHRDYHPTNLLWVEDRLCGVVDWVNGCRGPAGVDLAHCRHNLVAMYGPSVAEQFLAAYQQVVGPGFVYQPYWDLDTVLGALPQPTYYPPWLDFGLDRIPQDVLCEREEAYLRVILDQF